MVVVHTVLVAVSWSFLVIVVVVYSVEVENTVVCTVEPMVVVDLDWASPVTVLVT